MAKIIERKDIDDIYRRNNAKDSYKNRTFGGKKSTIDEYSGEKIFYGAKNVHKASKTVDIDHVTPVQILLDRYGDDIKNGDLTVEDLRKIATNDYNLKATSARINRSKGGKTNAQYLWEQARAGKPEDATTTYNMLESQLCSEAHVRTDVVVKKISHKLDKIDKGLGKTVSKHTNDVGEVAAAGAKAGLFAVTVSGINNLVQAGRGKKSIDEALKDTMVDGGLACVTEVSRQTMVKCISKAAANTSLKSLGRISVNELACGVMVANSVKKYLNDEITAEECGMEIMMNGVGAVAFKAGMALGGPAGAVVSSVVVGAIESCIMNTYYAYKLEKEMNRKRIAALNRLLEEADEALNEQKARLEEMIAEKQRLQSASFGGGLDRMVYFALENDSEGIADGLNMILSYFNKRSRFSTMEEFNKFFDDKEAVFVL